MDLRIHRSFVWENANPPGLTVLGGQNLMKLVSYDKLQYKTLGGEWQDVPIVKDPVPVHPTYDIGKKE